ncbi:MAG TPA: FtsL-like putative cell division protein [Bacteroidales bacterium]|nr:FtsL-like putative cell division protein [Bacteroidales bacterium]HPI67731.1 FtsL-like putative cell division protein [Bacteroidales bacterium]HPR72671.1 FtsL-like putative cell division protein [Bacteroidales bacterium]
MTGKRRSFKNSNGNKKTGSFMKELLSGSMVTEKIILGNLWYVLLLTLLAAIYIGNRFHAEKITRETTVLQSEVKDLRAESLSVSADLIFISRQSEVYRMVKEKGLELEELKTPPYRLLVVKK